MSSEAGKQKLAINRIVAPESISDAEWDGVERSLARFVALAYFGDHPDLCTAGTERSLFAEVPLGTEGGQHD
jgi:hypothetical protein